MLSIQDRMTKTFQKIERANQRVNQSLAVTDRLSEQANPGAGFQRGSAQIEKAGRQVDNFNNKQKKAEEGARGVERAWGGVGGLIKTAVAAFGVKQVIGLADTMTQTTARLNLMNDGLHTTAELQNKIMASANQSRAAYQDTASAVAKLGMLAGKAFSSNDEIIAFTELMNKNFVIGGAGAQEQASAMYQLTQAMASGRLQGDEYRSIIENAPMLAKAIEAYMQNAGVEGTMKDWASEGLLTADVIKNALFSTADETNRKFAEIPMSFAQVGTIAGNVLLKTFTPAIQTIGKGAQWIYDNWSTIEPIFFSVAAGIGGAAAAWAIYTTAQWIATGAAKAFFTTLAANPLFWVVLVVGLVVAAIARWVQSVGGLRIAWLITCNALMTAWDWVKIGFMTGVYWVMDLLNKLQLAFKYASTGMANYMGDMKVAILTDLQNMVNGALEIIKGFIDTLNKIPGVNIALIEQVTFGTTAQMENDAAKQARNSGLDAYRNQIEAQIAERDDALNQMKAAANAATAMREAEIASARYAKAQEQVEANTNGNMHFDPYSELDGIGKVGEVGKIKEDVNIAEEDLKFLRDVAEMRYVQNFVTLTPTVAVDAQISEQVDIDEVVSRIENKLEDEFVAAAEGVYN